MDEMVAWIKQKFEITFARRSKQMGFQWIQFEVISIFWIRFILTEFYLYKIFELLSPH